MHRLLVAAITLAALSACGERPEEQNAQSDTATGNDAWLIHPEIWHKAKNPIDSEN